MLFAAGCDNITTPEPGEENRGATQTAGAQTGYPNSPTQVVLPETGASFDQLFIDMVVPYQQGAVILSQEIQERAEHQELKDFAANQVETQQAEAERLLALREQWFGSRQTPALDQRPELLDIALLNAPSVAEPTDVQTIIDRVRGSQGTPDLAYIDAIIEHHQILQSAAEMALTQGQHPETKQIAQELIDDYSREVERLMAWRSQWMSGITPQSPPTSPTAAPQGQ